MTIRNACIALALAACRASSVHDAGSDAGSDAGDAGLEAAALAPIESTEPSPDLFCLEQVNEREVAGTIAFERFVDEACADAQPILAEGARQAMYTIETTAWGLVLLRAARRHPAFPKECDIPDADAGKRPSVAFRGRAGCNDAEHQNGGNAGLHIFQYVLLRVAWRKPKRPDWFGSWIGFMSYEQWKQGLR